MPDREDDPAAAVFKIGAACHIDELLNEGCVFMNTASYYATLEATDPRSDQHEGASFCIQATGATLSVEIGGQFQQIGTLTGPIVHLSDELKGANVFCLHVLRKSSYDSVFSLDHLKFGDAAAIFTNYPEFLRRVARAAERIGHRVSYDFVEYVDRDTHNGPMGLFRKFSSHVHQSEHRIAIVPGTGAPLRLLVGNLTDIAVRVSADDRLKLTPKTLP